MSDKLPEWPENSGVRYVGESLLHAELTAALARMEALVETLRMVDPFCDELHHEPKDYHSHDEPCPVRQRIDRLLAACERSYAAQPSGAGRRKS